MNKTQKTRRISSKLLNHSDEIGLSELSIQDNIGLLAYSPLTFGALSEKYLRDKSPSGSRMTLFERFSRYNSINTDAARPRTDSNGTGIWS